MKYCIYCNKELTGRKLKYCDELCKYRHLSIQNNKPTKFKISQHLRMMKAGRNQRKGKIGVRYN